MSNQLRSLEGANPYVVLGVASDADEATIASAHRRLIREKHPDAPGGSEEAAKLLNAARDVLLNVLLRAEYDAQVREAAYAQYVRAQPSTHATWASYHTETAASHESPNAQAWDAVQRNFTQYAPSHGGTDNGPAPGYVPPDYLGNRRSTPSQAATRWSGWAIGAAFFALVFPPVGFVVGVIAYHLVRFSEKRGWVLSIVAVLVSLLLMARSALLHGTLFAFGGFTLYVGLMLFVAWVTWKLLSRFR